MAEPALIPSLDAIAGDVRLAAGLPVEITAILMHRCASVIKTLASEHEAQAKAQKGAISPYTPSDRSLNADEIAAALGTNRRWVFRNSRKLPFVRRISRKCVVGSEAGLRRWRDSQKG